MKNIIYILMVLVIFSAGCTLFEEEEMVPVDMADLKISDDFNYETERWVDVELYALYDGTFYLKDMEGNMLYKGMIHQDGGFKQKIKLPTSITEVKIEYREVETEVKNYRIRNNEIVYSFVPQFR